MVEKMMILGPLIVAVGIGISLMPLSYAEYPSPLQQIRDGVAPEYIQCNADKVHVIRSNGSHACVTERTAERMGWEIVLAMETKPSEKTAADGVVLETKENDGFTVLNVSSPVEFVDDGREIQRSKLQKAPAPWPLYERINSAIEDSSSVDSDGFLRIPTIPHEKYSVNSDGFYLEDWIPTYIPDGQKLLYAETECYPSGDCGLGITFVPTTFVLHKNVTNFDIDIAKGFKIGVEYSAIPFDEIEDRIEDHKEKLAQQSGNYGGFREMTRDGKTVWAYEGGNDLNHYQAGIGYDIDEHFGIGVHSYYHTLDELIPIFESIGN